jgi:hypothetical protein
MKGSKTNKGVGILKAFRDFIYMDTERLKSIVAQFNEGISENTTISSTESNQDKMNLSANLFQLLRAGGENTYLWQTQQTESQTLHDHIYMLAESLLKDENILTQIPGNIQEVDIISPNPENIKLTSTSFVLIEGKSFINDYIYMRNILENFSKITKSIVGGQIAADPQYEKYTKKELDRVINQESKKNELPKEVKDSISVLIDNFYKDRIVFKSVPFKNQPEFRFVGTLNPLYLREKIEDIIFKYGTAPRERWYLFAQIASIPTKDKENLDISASENSIEMAMQQVFDALRGVEKEGLSISFPEIAVTPIAIYRL